MGFEEGSGLDARLACIAVNGLCDSAGNTVSDVGVACVYGRRGGTTDSKAKPVPGVIVYRFGAPLVFANTEAFKNTGKALLIKAGAEGSLPHTVVVDFEEVAWVDATGAKAVSTFFDYAQRYGVDLSLKRK